MSDWRARLAAAIIEICNDGEIPATGEVVEVPASDLLERIEPIVDEHFAHERKLLRQANTCGERVFSMVCERQLDHSGPHWSATHGFFGTSPY